MFIRSSRGDGISWISPTVETAFSRVWSAGIITCSILLVLVQVLSVIWARVVWVTVWIACGLWLLRVARLRLGTLGSYWLLSLSNWVWSGVAARLALSSSGIT
jgi:hypothetical protein